MRRLMSLMRLFGLLVLGFALVGFWGCEQQSKAGAKQTGSASEKRGYVRVKQPDDALSKQEKIHIVEFFWYGCPHCNAFRDYFQPWLKEWEGKVQHVAIPVGLKPEWIDHARAFYAAQALSELPRFHNAFYDALHVQQLDLNSSQEIVQFVASLGIDAEKFAQAMDAESTTAAITADGELTRRYGVNTTPTLVVDGKYLVSPPTAGGYDAMLDVVEDLIAQR